MSAEVQPLQGQSESKKRSVLPGQVWIHGRVREVERNDKGVFTEIQSAAADEYSMPGLHEVQSKRQIGRPGEVVTVLCQCGGYRITGRNVKTGESFKATRNTLRLIEE